MLESKTIVVTGAANGIGAETAKRVRALGATVVGVDLVEPKDPVDRFVAADLSKADAIKTAAREIGPGIDGLANIAGLPPTAGRVAVLGVNFVGLRAFTEAMIGNLNEGAAIVNLASLAGAGWPARAAAVKAFVEEAAFDNIDGAVRRPRHRRFGFLLLQQGGAHLLDHAEPLDMAGARRPHELRQPRAGGDAHPAGLPRHPGGTSGGGHEDHGPAWPAGGHRASGGLSAVRWRRLDSRRQHSGGRRPALPPAREHARVELSASSPGWALGLPIEVTAGRCGRGSDPKAIPCRPEAPKTRSGT